jgi:hypothetical protein
LIAIKHEIYENNNKIGEIKRRLGVENIWQIMLNSI